MKRLIKNPMSLFLRGIVYISAALTILVLISLVGYIIIKGIPAIKPSLFEWEYTSENVSMMPAIFNTIIMTIVSLLIAVPVGVFSAIYLVEYAKKGNKLVSMVRITTETLSGIPSIVYGLFGALVFVEYLKFGKSILAGSLTMSIMILPTIMRTTEEALISVPNSFREGSLGLGAGKLRTVFKIVLPYAMPGILSGVILSMGRIVGETAALIYTAGTVTGIPQNLMSSGRTLSIHMYALWNEGLNAEESYATAVVLLLIVIVINDISSKLANKIVKKG